MLVYKASNDASSRRGLTMANDTLAGRQIARDRAQFAALWPALVAIALGFSILYVVGFAGAQTIHNAAHDTRHSLNFPCH
jgi:cobalt transporter subunit CbtB